MKAMVRSPNGYIDLFDIVASVLQVYILAPCPLPIYLDHLLQMSVDQIKDKKQTTSYKNYDSCKLCRWFSTSHKYICPTNTSE